MVHGSLAYVTNAVPMVSFAAASISSVVVQSP